MPHFSALTATLPQLPEWAPLAPNTPFAVVTALAFDGAGSKLHKSIVPIPDTTALPVVANVVANKVYDLASRPCLSMAIVWVAPRLDNGQVSQISTHIEEALSQNGVSFDGSYRAESINHGKAVRSLDGAPVGHCGKNWTNTVETRWSMHDLLLLPTSVTSTQAAQAHKVAESVYHAPKSRECSENKPLPPAVADCYATYMDILNDLDTQPCTRDVIEYLLAAPERIHCAAEVCKYAQMRDVALAPLFDKEFSERQVAFWSACASLFTGNMRANAYAALTIHALVNEDTTMAIRAMRLAYCANEANSLTGLLVTAMAGGIAPLALANIKSATDDLLAQSE
ncbi:DUF4192 family protein [Corynebacterium amycolatum]|uniref:DUF4192 family protein n=1 Tax=Corynebacterium amycolatum TaxID=43765 RepID=UPI002549D2CE|nr:DUF4192 family protein [Corynebacterium amycolatum]MDK7145181.1 DUF4192 family protein [Corynebacterium amycolatum]